MDEKKLLIKEHKDLIDVLYFLLKGQKIIMDSIYNMGDNDMDSRVKGAAFDGEREWNKNMKNISQHIAELQSILKVQKNFFESREKRSIL